MSNDALQLINKRLIGENSKFFIYFHHVVDNELGFEVEDYLVVSPKLQTDQLVSGVAILPIADNKVGLVRMYRPAINGFTWEIPHGFIELGEPSHRSALRELAEETGILSENVSSLGYILPDAGLLSARVHLFVASDCAVQVSDQKELGLKAFKFFDFDTFEDMIKSSEVQDAFTLSAWCRYKLSL